MQLGATFPVKLEAPHVVNVQKQVWAGAISHGADGTLLQATYKHADTAAFQDSVGQSVVAVCKVVPDGVLMFLPSYSMLDRLMTRWKVGHAKQQCLDISDLCNICQSYTVSLARQDLGHTHLAPVLECVINYY